MFSVLTLKNLDPTSPLTFWGGGKESHYLCFPPYTAILSMDPDSLFLLGSNSPVSNFCANFQALFPFPPFVLSLLSLPPFSLHDLTL